MSLMKADARARLLLRFALNESPIFRGPLQRTFSHVVTGPFAGKHAAEDKLSVSVDVHLASDGAAVDQLTEEACAIQGPTEFEEAFAARWPTLRPLRRVIRQVGAHARLLQFRTVEQCWFRPCTPRA